MYYVVVEHFSHTESVCKVTMVKENTRKSEVSGFKRVSELRGVKKKKSRNARDYDGPPKEFWKGFKDQAADKWYSEIMDDPEDSKTLPAEQVNTLKTEAQKLLENEIETYNRKMSKSSGGSNYNWLRNFISSGTISDKIAAYTIAVQDSPVHSLPILRNFVNMVKVGKKKECVQVLETLTELFLSHLLRPDKKLRTFDECPLSVLDQCSSQNKRKSCLILWYFEDQLKELYQTFIKALNTAAHDSVESNKEKAVTSMYKLLSGNPEQESVLLSCLVNKLGDPSQRVASKAIYHLIQLLNVHSNMKFVVMEETEKLLFRPNVGKRAQYYGICFLSQFLLAKEETSLAKNLIRIYLSFFKACVKQGEVDSRLLSALLTGVNRAYPFAKSVMDSMSEHVDTLYKVVHLGNFSISVHTLSLLFQVADYTNSTSDRFYSALYKKLLDPQLGSSSQQAPFLNLVFKALKKDEDTNRVKVFIKRLLQVCCYLPAPIVCGILLMLSQIKKKKKNDNVLVCQMVPSKFLDDDADEEGEEYYEDVKLEEMETEDQKDNLFVEPKPSTSAATWYHCKNNMNGIDKKPKVKRKTYDAYQRNPTFAGGEYCNHIELLKLAHHYHPSVAHFTQKLLQGETLNYSGDALLDFTLPRFLDRFVFKNPKKISDTEYAGSSVFSRKRSYLPSGMKSLRVDTAGYLNEDEENIPVDELFLYRFLQKKRQQKGEDKDDDENDASSVASEEFLDMLTKGKDTVDFAEELGKAEIEKVKAGKKNKTETSSEESESDGDDFESEAEEDEDEDEVDSEGEEMDGDKAEEEKEQPSDDDIEDENDASDDKFLEDYLLKDVKQKKHFREEDGSEDDDDDDDELDDDNDDDGDDEEAIVFDSDEESEDQDDDDEDSEQEMKKTKTKKGAKLTPEQKFRKKLKGQVAFMPAEKFAELLEERGAIGRKMTGSNALSHKSVAEMKQLKWEADRDFWLNRADKKNRFGTKRKRSGSGKVSGTTKKFRKK